MTSPLAARLLKSRLMLAAFAAAFGAVVGHMLLRPGEPTQVQRPGLATAAAPPGVDTSAAPAASPAADRLAALPATPAASPAQAASALLQAPPLAAIVPLPFELAVLKAADSLLANAQIDVARLTSANRIPLVIDPLVDGIAGTQTVATRTIGERLAALIINRYPRYEVHRFSSENLAQMPLVLLGTLTGVNAVGNPAGERESYRVWLTLVDLRANKVVGKARTYAQVVGVNANPTATFRDSPAWTKDPATLAYIEACQKSHLGDPINPAYIERIHTAAAIADAIDAYDAGEYLQSLGKYTQILQAPEGNQLRVHTGIYLNHWKLKNRAQAQSAFAKIVEFGLSHRLLAMKFEFRPGSAAFGDQTTGVPTQYAMWLRTIASKVATSSACMELTGHSSPTGPEPLNERLSFKRAEFVQARLIKESLALDNRTLANGVGSRQTMIGTARDDDTDALDRRVEMKLFECSR